MTTGGGSPLEGRELEALQGIARTAGRPVELERLLSDCLAYPAELLGARGGALYLIADEPTELRLMAVRGFDRSACPSVLSAARDPLSARHHYTKLLEAELKGQAAHAVVLPLTSGESPFGLLALYVDDPGPSPTLRPTLDALIRFASVAIGNRLAQCEAEERIAIASTLRKFGQHALSVSEQASLRALTLDTALALVGGDQGWLTIRSEDRWRVCLTRGLPADCIDLEMPAPPDQLRVGAAVELAGSTRIAELARARDWTRMLLLPLHEDGTQICNLALVASGSDSFKQNRLEALTLLASMAIEARARRRMEAAAEQLHAELGRAIEHLPAAVAVVDETRSLTHLNAAGRELVRHCDIMETASSLLDTTLAGQVAEAMEVTTTCGELKRTMLATAAPLPLAEGPHAVLVLQDVTKLRELAESKERFITTASHQLRSRLASLRATASLLQAGQVNEEASSSLARRMSRQVERLQRLIEQMLESARLGTAEIPLYYNEFDLVAVLREVIDVVRTESRSHEVALEAAAPAIGQWDQARIEQAVHNLISNAVLYGDPAHPVTVKLESDEARALISVIDRGAGIEPEDLSNLFHPFARGRGAALRHPSGLGLGLHIASEVARRHGGRLHVQSEAGRGSTFSLELPRRRRTS